MARALSNIDRLLEEGLTRYGRGDLDGALTSWEQVLDLDPHHEEALGYIDYVRMNYELLVGEVSVQAEAPAFAIGEDEPAYQIEAAQGELAEGSAVPRYGTVLDGWAIEDEGPGGGPLGRQQITLEIEGNEPELELELEPFHLGHSPESEPTGINFEDATKEYANADREDSADDDAGGSQEFRLEMTPTPGFEPEATPGFGTPGDLQTPQGFVTQRTEIRVRELGFVQPVEPPAPVTPPARPAQPVARAVGGSPPEPPVDQELEVETVLRRGNALFERTDPPSERTSERTSERPFERPFERSFERTGSLFDLPPDVDPPTIERSPSSLPPELLAVLPGAPPDPRDLSRGGLPPHGTTPVPSIPPTRSTIEGLPPVRTSAIPPPSSPPQARTPTPRPMPPITHAVPERPGRGDPGDFDAPTERKDLRVSSAAKLAAGTSGAREATPAARPGARAPSPLPLAHNPLVTAPTRDLGLRPEGATPRVRTEDLPAGPAEPGGGHRAPPVPKVPAVTHTDVVLPFDPIDARAAQILGAIDARSPAPPDESREDRTRRRITALFEKAVEWNKAGELDRAVTAIDLALSEDPNSALAQKLIHRNRDTMMTVFQAFLGDLHRMPILARPLHELAGSPISPRAAFLLSRVDGLLSIDEILDVAGMSRIEAFRYLCQLFLRGILR
jgi:hypothetical protein